MIRPKLFTIGSARIWILGLIGGMFIIWAVAASCANQTAITKDEYIDHIDRVSARFNDIERASDEECGFSVLSVPANPELEAARGRFWEMIEAGTGITSDHMLGASFSLGELASRSSDDEWDKLNPPVLAYIEAYEAYADAYEEAHEEWCAMAKEQDVYAEQVLRWASRLEDLFQQASECGIPVFFDNPRKNNARVSEIERTPAISTAIAAFWKAEGDVEDFYEAEGFRPDRNFDLREGDRLPLDQWQKAAPLLAEFAERIGDVVEAYEDALIAEGCGQ